MLLATVNDPKAGWEPWTESWLFTFPTPYLGVDPLWNDLPEVLICFDIFEIVDNWGIVYSLNDPSSVWFYAPLIAGCSGTDFECSPH